MFVADDCMALPVLSVPRTELRPGVPEDVAVIGVIDVPHAAAPEHDLATLRQLPNPMIEHAMRIMAAATEHPASAPERVALAPVPTPRGSTSGRGRRRRRPWTGSQHGGRRPPSRGRDGPGHGERVGQAHAMTAASNESGSRADGLRVVVLGATGTAGRAAARALSRAGHRVTCLVRPGPDALPPDALPSGVRTRHACVTDPASLAGDGFRGERFDALVSCLASRSGSPRDAWAIDHRAHSVALAAAREAGVRHVVLLSAICVQKPLLAFQRAKLAFERELIGSGVTYSIVRPTAFFKSLSGQIERVRRGRPFLVFGDGARTACKPIGDDDLGTYIAECLTRPDRRDRVLPIGGPGRAITPRDQGEMLFELLGTRPRFRRIPLPIVDGAVGALGLLGRVRPVWSDKAELARIARYYATESMLVLDPATGCYDAEATPAAGTRTLRDHYAAVLAGSEGVDLREHAVF